jgi:anti-sigma B factor antagonist
MKLSVTAIGKFKLIKLGGRIDWENARNLDKKIQNLVDSGHYHIVFNLDEVTFMCSGGIGALIYNLNKIRKNNGGIYLISSNHYIEYIFETLKFDIVFEGYLFKTFDEFLEKVVDCQTA